jgi:hypothetical protein
METVPMRSPIIQDATLYILARICGFLSSIMNNNCYFCLKGGMAFEILHQNKFPLDINPDAGNDFDTILLINPELTTEQFNYIKTYLKSQLGYLFDNLFSNKMLTDSVKTECIAKGIPLASPEKPFFTRTDNDYWADGKPMNIDLISIFLNTQYDVARAYFKTKLIDISIPHRTYNLLRFDFKLYKMPGRIILKTINGYTIFIADFLSILFDQSVTKTLNTNPNESKRKRRTNRIEYIKPLVEKEKRNSIINNITPYLQNNILNGLVTNGVVSNYKKTIEKAPPLLSTSTVASTVASYPTPTTVVSTSAPTDANSSAMAELQKRIAESLAAKAAAKAAANAGAKK